MWAEMANRYVQSWMAQAQHDMQIARRNLGASIYDDCVVHCQQAVEKALKALHIALYGELAPKTHSLEELAKLTSMTDDLDSAVFQLEKDYFELRYPDEAGRAPFERCTREHAEAALAAAEGALAVIARRVAAAGECPEGSNPAREEGMLPELPDSPPQDISASPEADPQIRRFAEKYLARVKAMYGPVQLWVFGSRVRGEPYQYSDIDLLVVSERFREFARDERRSTFLRETGLADDREARALHTFCYTPEEFEQGKRAPCIIREAVRCGIRIA